MKLFGQTQLLEDVREKDLCVGCGACVGLCPYFTSYRGKTAMLFPCDRETGRCFAFCPKTEVDYDELYSARFGEKYAKTPLGPYQEIIKAKAGDKLKKSAFQCGGAVTALVACALENKIINAAVLTDRKNMMPAPILAKTIDEALDCAGSKYMASPTISLVNQAANNGIINLGVVATPCQALALALMRANPTEIPDFSDPTSLVIGLFCTWALDARKLEALVAEKIGKPVKRMDIPPPPSEILVVETDEGIEEIPLSFVRPIIPAGCSICPDMTSELADVSVGVVEGEEDANTLIIRTEKGADLIKKAISDGFLETSQIDPKKIEHLMVAATNKRKRALTQAQNLGLLNTKDDAGHAAMRMSESTVKDILS